MGEWSQWYSEKRWRHKRASHLAREPLCRHCLEAGIVTEGREVDHIEPHRGDRDKFWQGDLQTLCKPCHSIKTQAEMGNRAKVRVNVKGEPQGWE